MTDRILLAAFLALSSTSASFGSAFVVPRIITPTTTSTINNRNLVVVFEEPHLGAGGMADTRDPDALEHEDKRKSISEAPSFEEYLKMRETGGDAAAAVTPAAAPPAAPVATSPAAASAAATSAGGGSAEAAIATLDASQQASVAAIAAAIPDLAAKPDLAWTAQDGVTIAGCSATLDARDAPGPANIAWLSSLCIAGKESSLTIFNGPLNDVPHLLSRCCVMDDNTLSFVLDFRPRAYGAYEQKDAEGNYPGPEELGRKAFEYSGARGDYFNKFVTEDDVVAFLAATKHSLEGAVDSTAEMNALSGEEELLTQGPHKLSLTMPLTDGNVAAVAAAREKAASYWLGWATDGAHEHRPGAQVNTQYVYDSKYKINAYGALLPVYKSLYGPEDGAKLTAAESGPLDEAYVGGGS